jgi:hypothetical protein
MLKMAGRLHHFFVALQMPNHVKAHVADERKKVTYNVGFDVNNPV